MSVPSTTPPTQAHTMQCMEVWGGNREIDNGVVMPGLDAWVYARPYSGDDQSAEGGGDVHYVSSCATGRITRILVADVAGHGSGVDQLARGLRVLMRKFVNYSDQTKFVHRLNREFHEMSRDCKFATAVVLTYWGPNGHLSVCNAGHPRPLLYRAASKEWAFLRDEGDLDGADNLPLGVDPGSVYGPYELKIRAGDIVLLYTDALIEARRGDGALLGEGGLLGIVEGLDAGDPGALIHEVLQRIEQWGGAVGDDDVTMLAIRNNGVGMPNLGAGTGLRAGLDLVKAFFGSFKPGGKVMAFPQMTWTNFAGAFSRKVSERFGKQD